ncbi:hypothetical protein J4401_00510 [Candidatus Woesearchaeota archaeon]|nr:hypothetical protein [Candidatus Woesearchaeota archaeon]
MKGATSTGNIPEKKFSTGVISATVWKNTGKNSKGEEIEYRTVSLQRRYKDKNNAWQTSGSLRINDLPKATLVLSKAYEFAVLRDTQMHAEEEEISEEIVM